MNQSDDNLLPRRSTLAWLVPAILFAALALLAPVYADVMQIYATDLAFFASMCTPPSF